jgi:hypothetical protein
MRPASRIVPPLALCALLPLLAARGEDPREGARLALQRKAALVALQNLVAKESTYRIDRDRLVAMLSAGGHRRPALHALRAALKQTKQTDELFSGLLHQAAGPLDGTGKLERWLADHSSRRQPGQAESLKEQTRRLRAAYLDGPKLQADHDRARADLTARQVTKARQAIRDDKDRTRYHPDVQAVERAHGGARERAEVIALLVRRLDPKEELLEEAGALVSRLAAEMLDEGLKQLAEQLRCLERASSAHSPAGMRAELLDRLGKGREPYGVFPLARRRAGEQAAVFFDRAVAAAATDAAGRFRKGQLALAAGHEAAMRREILAALERHLSPASSRRELQALFSKEARVTLSWVREPLCAQARAAPSPHDTAEDLEALPGAVQERLAAPGSLPAREQAKLAALVEKQLDAALGRARKEIAAEQARSQCPRLAGPWRPNEEALAQDPATLDRDRLKRLPLWDSKGPGAVLDETFEIWLAQARQAIALGRAAMQGQMQSVRAAEPGLIRRIKAEPMLGLKHWVEVATREIGERWQEGPREAAKAHRALFPSVRKAITGAVSSALDQSALEAQLALAKARKADVEKRIEDEAADGETPAFTPHFNHYCGLVLGEWKKHPEAAEHPALFESVEAFLRAAVQKAVSAEVRKAQVRRKAEKARKVEEARKTEERRKAEDARKAAERARPAVVGPVKPVVAPVQAAGAGPEGQPVAKPDRPGQGKGQGAGTGGDGEKPKPPPPPPTPPAPVPVVQAPPPPAMTPGPPRAGKGGRFSLVLVCFLLAVVLALLAAVGLLLLRRWGPAAEWMDRQCEWVRGWLTVRELIPLLGADFATRLRRLRLLAALVQAFGDEVEERLDSLFLPASPPLRAPRDYTGITATPRHRMPAGAPRDGE